MPSNSPIVEVPGGRLFVVATPIGNLADITLRALEILKSVDRIAAEDTRHSRRLLAHHGIDTPLVSYHEHNAERRTPELIADLSAGKDVALVSDAGTPTVSDPGFRLIRAAAREGIAVIPIPGVSAVSTALSVAGLPTDRFTFVGFVPKKAKPRQEMLAQLADRSETLIFFESPRRIEALLNVLMKILGNRPAVIAREMTKLHEEFLRGPLSALKEELGRRETVRGEITLLVTGAPEEAPPDMERLRDALLERMVGDAVPLSAVARDVARRFGLPRAEVYAAALKLKDEGATRDP
jgi:16S rRNA (cytidine1402-2'-O)-methyltransferase